MYHKRRGVHTSDRKLGRDAFSILGQHIGGHAFELVASHSVTNFLYIRECLWTLIEYLSKLLES